jgi:Na+/H+ antiporter NhaD/arsenite permease-like protein
LNAVDATAGVTADDLRTLLAAKDGPGLLAAISLGAVFMGAITYIGNGPNFMVKAIAESSGVKMPGFFGYLGYSVAVLVPILLVLSFAFL